VSRFFQPNISHRGRLARGVIGALCLIAGIIVAGDVLWWAGLILVAAGLFAIFEALTRWCLVRACGIKTKV
jgi:membrane-bound ClpP family serine protease